MRRVVVRYRVKADRVAEHEELIARVFAELAALRPAGLAYQALKLEDGVSFIHVAAVSTPDGANPLTSLPAFKAFTENIRDRVDEPVVSTPVTTLRSKRSEPRGAVAHRG